MIEWLPLIASAIGGLTSLLQGNQAEQQNREYMQRADAATAAQQQLIGQLMAGMSPQAYRDQAAMDGQAALGQLSANFAGRGMLSSGALHTAGASTLSQLYANATARHQQDRMNAIGMALGGQQAIRSQYADNVNPNPYAGLGQALSGIGTAAGQYLYRNPLTPAATTGNPLPGFGARYTSPFIPSSLLP